MSDWRYTKITRETAEKYEAPTGELTYFLSTAKETDGKVTVFDAYFPKGSGKDRDNSRVPYKLGFYAAVFERIEQLRRRGPVFVVGDYNTAHQSIDLARPKTNQKSSGHLPEERAEMTRWMDAGWVDVFRRQHPVCSFRFS